MMKFLLAAAILAGSLAITGCGPNDRLRDTYMGKPQSGDYRPVKRDEYGNPILKPDQ